MTQVDTQGNLFLFLSLKLSLKCLFQKLKGAYRFSGKCEKTTLSNSQLKKCGTDLFLIISLKQNIQLRFVSEAAHIALSVVTRHLDQPINNFQFIPIFFCWFSFVHDWLPLLTILFFIFNCLAKSQYWSVRQSRGNWSYFSSQLQVNFWHQVSDNKKRQTLPTICIICF